MWFMDMVPCEQICDQVVVVSTDVAGGGAMVVSFCGVVLACGAPGGGWVWQCVGGGLGGHPVSMVECAPMGESHASGL